MKRRIISILFTFVLVIGTFMTFVGCKDKNTITIASKDFTEQDVLGNMMLVYLSENTEYNYKYKNEMSSNIVFSAMKQGSADLYIDYTGTVYGNYLQKSEIKTAEEVYDISKKEIKEKFDLEMFESLGHNNTYTLSVTKETAEKHSLETFSDLAKVAKDLAFGGTFEILNRNDGIPGLEKAYNMEFKEKLSFDGALRYIAIENKEVDVIDAFSTDGLLEKYELVTLKDDKSFFPPYYAVPIVRAEILERFPEIEKLLKDLKGILNDETMRQMNYRVDVLRENAKDVATEFLQEKNLI